MKKTFKYWIYANSLEGRAEPYFTLSDIEWTDRHLEGRVLISEHEVEHEIPCAREVTPMMVKALEAKRETMRAAAAAAITEVDNQIASLLALENMGESA